MKKRVFIAAIAAVFCFSFMSPLRAEEIIEFEAYSKSINAHAEKIVPNDDLTSKEEFFHFAREEFKNEKFNRAVNFEETRATVVKGSLGWITGFMFHELGHICMAKMQNIKTEYDFSNIIDPRLEYDNPNNEKNKFRRVHFAGFVAEILSAEIILGIDKIPKDNAVVLGWLAFDVFNPFIYALKDELYGGGYGDMKSLRKKGVNTDLLKAAMIMHSAVSVYRIYKKPSAITPYVGVAGDQITAGVFWKW